MEGGNLYSALNGPEKENYLWYANGQSLAMDIVRGIFYLHGTSPPPPHPLSLAHGMLGRTKPLWPSVAYHLVLPACTPN